MTADYERPTQARPRPVVESCWLCGTRLPVSQMTADGGSGCDNVRWYCGDVRACTERWTTRRIRPDYGRQGHEESSAARAAAGG